MFKALLNASFLSDPDYAAAAISFLSALKRRLQLGGEEDKRRLKATVGCDDSPALGFPFPFISEGMTLLHYLSRSPALASLAGLVKDSEASIIPR